MINNSVKYGRFTVVKESENRFNLLSVNDAVLKSGSYQQCIAYADELERM